jgi:hypothetical protein
MAPLVARADRILDLGEIASELRRGADYVRVTIALTVVTTDLADALAIAWDAFRSAARDDLTGCEVTVTSTPGLLPARLETSARRAGKRSRRPVGITLSERWICG